MKGFIIVKIVGLKDRFQKQSKINIKFKKKNFNTIISIS